MILTHRQLQGVTIINPEGKITLGDGDQELGEAVRAVLDQGWIDETVQFIQRVSTSDKPRAGIFRYARSPYSDTHLRDGFKFIARMITGPSAEQGLLIAKDHYERLGGYAPDARRSEAKLLRRLGRSSRTLLRSRIMVA